MPHKFSSGPFYLFQLIVSGAEASAINKQKSQKFMPLFISNEWEQFSTNYSKNRNFIAKNFFDWKIYGPPNAELELREKLFMGKFINFNLESGDDWRSSEQKMREGGIQLTSTFIFIPLLSVYVMVNCYSWDSLNLSSHNILMCINDVLFIFRKKWKLLRERTVWAGELNTIISSMRLGFKWSWFYLL